MRTIRIKIIWVILLNLIVLQMYSQGLLFRNTDGIIDVVMSKTVTSIVPTDNQNGLNLILKDGSKKVYSSYSLENLETFNFQENITALNITYGTVSDVTSESATIKGISTNFTLNLSSSYTIYVLYGKANNLSPDYSLNAYATTTNRTCDIKLNKLSPSTQYYYQTLIKVNGKYYTGEVKSFTTEEIPVSSYCPDSNHPHVIDLGLPSGTKWACCNVGANNPEDYGGYYAWGETNTKSNYTWDTYKYGYYTYNMDFSHLTSIGDNIAGTIYDAATANWGSSWRMPTITQLKELFEKCSIEWTSQNGNNGHKITGPNGVTLFLPATGIKGKEGLENRGTQGRYWSSSLYDSTYLHVAYELRLFPKSEKGNWYDYFDDRYMGLTIRPVRVGN